MAERTTTRTLIPHPSQLEAMQQSNQETELEKQQAELESARSAVARIYAKNRSRVIKDDDVVSQSVVNRYNKLVVDHGKAVLSDELANIEDESQKNAKVLEYIFEKQRELSEAIDKRTNSSLVYRFRKAFDEVLSSGGKFRQFLKRKGLSAVGALIGGATGGLIGASAGVGASEGFQKFAKHRFDSVADRTEAVSADKVKEVAEKANVDLAQQQDHTKVFQIAQEVSMFNLGEVISEDRKKYYKALGRAAVKGGFSGGLVFATGSVAQWISPNTLSASYATELPAVDNTTYDLTARGDAFNLPSGGNALDLPLDDSTNPPPNDTDIRKNVDYFDLPSEGNTFELPSDNSVETESNDAVPAPSPEVEAGNLFDFSYGAAPEHLLEEVVQEQLGKSLTDAEAYKLINHLMEETDGNIFDGVDTEWRVPGKNVWIMDPGGETSGLTEEALAATKEWLAHKSTGLPSTGV